VPIPARPSKCPGVVAIRRVGGGTRGVLVSLVVLCFSSVPVGGAVQTPERFQVRFETSVGDFTVEVHRDWAPLGADRFYELVGNGYYDDARFHRAVPGFIVQWGLAGDPAVTREWRRDYIADDPVVASNTRGRIAFAFTDPGTRATQVYLSTVDNSRLDAEGFSPFGEVVDGMDVVDLIYSGYGEASGGGVRRGDQSRIVAEGNAYLDAEFPKLTRLYRARLTSSPDWDAAGDAPTIRLDTAAVTRWVESVMGHGQFPAAAVVIVDGSGPLYLRSFGVSGTDHSLSTDSRFYLGASTGALTALGVQQLVSTGAVTLDSPLIQYLPDLRFADRTRGAQLTVEHLLRHASGLPAIAAFNRRVQETGRIERVHFFADPGTEVEYSGLNDLLLGALIEEVSGLPYGDFMRWRVFGPLGMTRTTAFREEAEAEGLVQGHGYLFGWPVVRRESEYADRMIPANYIVSTPADLGRYLQRSLASDMTPPLGPEQGPEWGWEASDRSGSVVWLRHGATAGFYSTLAILPNERLGIAVLTSRTAGPFRGAPSQLSDGVIRVVRGEAPNPYFPWERTGRVALSLLMLVGIYWTARLHRMWKALESPRRMAHTPGIVGRVIVDLTLAAVLPLWIIRGALKLPIQEILDIYPDIGVALILFPTLAIPASVLRALVTSELLRQRS
jgi:peptidyl-prolyl cis-trans isomerase A (cyclophilin A)